MSLDVLEIKFKNKDLLVVHDVKSTIMLQEYCSFIVKAASVFKYNNKVVKNYTFNLAKIETIKKIIS